MLTKDGGTRVTVGHYMEALHQKMDRDEEVVIRTTKVSGVLRGKVLSIGFSSFSLSEPDGDISTVEMDDVVDIQ